MMRVQNPQQDCVRNQMKIHAEITRRDKTGHYEN